MGRSGRTSGGKTAMREFRVCDMWLLSFHYKRVRTGEWQNWLSPIAGVPRWRGFGCRACRRRASAALPLNPATYSAHPLGLILLLTAMLTTGPVWGAAARKSDPTGPLILLAWLPVILLVFVALEVVLW